MKKQGVVVICVLLALAVAGFLYRVPLSAFGSSFYASQVASRLGGAAGSIGGSTASGAALVLPGTITIERGNWLQTMLSETKPEDAYLDVKASMERFRAQVISWSLRVGLKKREIKVGRRSFLQKLETSTLSRKIIKRQLTWIMREHA